jgi:curli production assembly/transport component CsgG
MHAAFKFWAVIPLALGAQGCAGLQEIRASAATAIATPGTGLLPPTAGAITETDQKLRDLPPPQAPIAVAVYGYGDQTGQFKPLAQGAMVQTLSRAVTQGATSILIKALQDAGNGRWFTVIERERLDNLLKERRIIADMRTRYLGEQTVDPQALPPLLLAGVLIDGGIVGYDSNNKTGGAGANYFGIGGDASYSEDTVTVYLRGTSVKNGQVLLSVVSTKKILSYGIEANAYRFVTFNRLLQAEIGFTRNEPGSLAVAQAIEQAVLQFIAEGAARGLWSFKDRGFQSRMIEDHELSYLAAAAKQDAPPPAKHASAAAKPAAPQAGARQPAGLAAVERQQASAGGNPGGAPRAQQPAQQPVQAFTVQPRTLEDEVPISPR